MKIEKQDWVFKKFGSAVGSTLLTTLYARAKVRDFYPAEQWHDEQAEQVWQALQEDASKEGIRIADFCLHDYNNMVGTIRRSEIFDYLTQIFIEKYQKSQVMTIGIGFCNRANRIINPGVIWYGIDVAPVVKIRKQYFLEDQTKLLAADLAQKEWINCLDPNIPTIFLLEGLSMYLHKEIVEKILETISSYMKANYELVADVLHTKTINTHRITKIIGANLTFGLDGSHTLADFAPGWKLHKCVDAMQYIGKSMHLFGRIFKKFFGRMPYTIEVIGK